MWPEIREGQKKILSNFEINYDQRQQICDRQALSLKCFFYEIVLYSKVISISMTSLDNNGQVDLQT